METVSSTLVLTGSADNTARLWDFELGKCLRTFESKSAIRTCCFSMLTDQLMYSTDTTMGQACELLLYEKGDSLCVQWLCSCYPLCYTRGHVVHHVVAAAQYTGEPLYSRHHWDQLDVLYTVAPLYSGHHWDPAGCPVYSGTSL